MDTTETYELWERGNRGIAAGAVAIIVILWILATILVGGETDAFKTLVGAFLAIALVLAVWWMLKIHHGEEYSLVEVSPMKISVTRRSGRRETIHSVKKVLFRQDTRRGNPYVVVFSKEKNYYLAFSNTVEGHGAAHKLIGEITENFSPPPKVIIRPSVPPN